MSQSMNVIFAQILEELNPFSLKKFHFFENNVEHEQGKYL